MHICALTIAGFGMGVSLALFGIPGLIPTAILMAIYAAWLFMDDYDAIADNIEYQPRHGKRAGIHRKI